MGLIPDTDRMTESTIERVGFGRRQLMKLLGASTALAIGSGNVAAKHNKPHPPQIDARYGYTTPNADETPRKLKPDHVVELQIDPGTPGENAPLFHFEPTGLAVEPGDIVQFVSQTPNHTITAYHPGQGYQRRIPEGVPPFSSPVLSVGSAWLYQFDTEGVYDMYCGPHALSGMCMRVVVGDLQAEDIPDYVDTFEGSQDPPTRPPFSKSFIENDLNTFSAENEDVVWASPTSRDVLGSDALDPLNITAGDGTVSYHTVLEEIDVVDVDGGRGQ